MINCFENFLGESLLLPPCDWDQQLIKPVIQAAMSARRKTIGGWRREPYVCNVCVVFIDVHRKGRQIARRGRHHEMDPSLVRNPKPFVGIFNNFKILKQRYKSDWTDFFTKDGLKNCSLAIIFGFIICIAPAVAFGGLMEEVTGNVVGMRETLLAHGLCGILYSIFSVQPIVIPALTGPVLVFEEVIFEVKCSTVSITY